MFNIVNYSQPKQRAFKMQASSKKFDGQSRPYSFRLVHNSLYGIGYFYPQLYFNTYVLYHIFYIL